MRQYKLDANGKCQRGCAKAAAMVPGTRAARIVGGNAVGQAAGTAPASQDQATQPQNSPGQSPAGEGARATQAPPETIVSPKEAKELFRSVDEILQFASQDTDLP